MGGPTRKVLRKVSFNGCPVLSGHSRSMIRVKCLPFSRALTDLLQRTDPAFNSAGIDNQRQPGHGRIPQLLVDFQEGKFDLAPGLIQQVNPLIDLADGSSAPRNAHRT